MKIKINNCLEEIDLTNPSVERLLEFKQISPAGTAVAVNNKLVRHSDWDKTSLNEGDELTIISAAFGG